LQVRLYAKGQRGGSGQCSLALRLSAEAALQSMLPLQVDLTVGSRTLQAIQVADPEGTDWITWLADSFGPLEDHLADELTDLTVRAALPLLSTPTLLASRTTLSPLSTRDDLHMLDCGGPEEAKPDQHVATSSVRARDSRGVQIRASEPPPSVSALPTLLGQEQPSGVFALRGAWGTSPALPTMGKASNPFDEQFSPLGTTGGPGQGQRNPVAIPADDAAR